jgi:hypothetical protein
VTDTEFAAYIDDLYAATNGTDLPLASQHWTPELLIEMYVSSTIGLNEDPGMPDEAFEAEIAGAELLVLIYRDGNEPPPLTPEQRERLDRAIMAAKAQYWRGKFAGRQS